METASKTYPNHSIPYHRNSTNVINKCVVMCQTFYKGQEVVNKNLK